MATGRTHSRWARVYVGGYDYSGKGMGIGPLAWNTTVELEAAMSDGIKNVKAGLPQPTVSPGVFNGWLDNTAVTGLHTLHSAPGSLEVVTVAVGIRAAPAAGDDVFCGHFPVLDYAPDADTASAGAVPATVTFGQWSNQGEMVTYGAPWGKLLHINSAATGVNSGTADHDHGAATAFGGWGVLHVTGGDGTATLSIEHSSVDADGNFDAGGDIVAFDTTACDITGADSPFGEIKATAATTTTVNRYLRWQVSLGTATTVTFVASFVRGIRAW